MHFNVSNSKSEQCCINCHVWPQVTTGSYKSFIDLWLDGPFADFSEQAFLVQRRFA
jgi:hypothetical protein